MNIFELRDRVVNDRSSYIRSFIRIQDERIERLAPSDIDDRLLKKALV